MEFSYLFVVVVVASENFLQIILWYAAILTVLDHIKIQKRSGYVDPNAVETQFIIFVHVWFCLVRLLIRAVS